MEEWFSWADEWSMLLRMHAGLKASSKVMEVGCGLGRIAFPLRSILSKAGSYDGFEICKYKVEFLKKNFEPSYPNFHFVWADVHNTFYNPEGEVDPSEYRFPYDDDYFDVSFAASVFTHMAPANTHQYFKETARVLKPGGRALYSFFLLDNYERERPRPMGFASPDFAFEHAHRDDPRVRISRPEDPEYMTAYRMDLLQEIVNQSGLEFASDPLIGRWSGVSDTWIGSQDVLLLRKPSPAGSVRAG
jgi:SAM-dependent methyltransferase